MDFITAHVGQLAGLRVIGEKEERIILGLLEHLYPMAAARELRRILDIRPQF